MGHKQSHHAHESSSDNVLSLHPNQLNALVTNKKKSLPHSSLELHTTENIATGNEMSPKAIKRLLKMLPNLSAVSLLSKEGCNVDFGQFIDCVAQKGLTDKIVDLEMVLSSDELTRVLTTFPNLTSLRFATSRQNILTAMRFAPGRDEPLTVSTKLSHANIGFLDLQYDGAEEDPPLVITIDMPNLKFLRLSGNIEISSLYCPNLTILNVEWDQESHRPRRGTNLAAVLGPEHPKLERIHAYCPGYTGRQWAHYVLSNDHVCPKLVEFQWLRQTSEADWVVEDNDLTSRARRLSGQE